MPSNTARVRMGAKGALVMARHPPVRWATVRAARPPAKLGWHVGKFVVRRQAHAQLERFGAAGRPVVSFVVIYGPMAADVFGLVEAPKPRRRAPFAAGIVIGAGGMYVLNRNNPAWTRGHGRRHIGPGVAG